MKLAIIDLDGVVADNAERFKRAEESRQSFHAYAQRMKQAGNTAGWQIAELERQEENAYWQTAFNPELVALDTLIEDANDHLLDLGTAGYAIILILTSRPESMREATFEWLFKQTVYGSNFDLIMKAPAFQYTKTTVWKAGMVQTLASLYDASEVLFIDDESANTTAVAESWQNATVKLRTWSSLKLADLPRPDES